MNLKERNKKRKLFCAADPDKQIREKIHPASSTKRRDDAADCGKPDAQPKIQSTKSTG